jgi:predicted phage baseplate assembly protein
VYEIDPNQATYEVPGAGGILTLNVTQGITYSNVTLGTSNGNAAQVFAIPQTGVIDGTITVDIESLTSITDWSYVQFLGDFGPSDQVFTTYLDQAGLTWVQFGDGINGAIPTSGYTVVAGYRLGAGTAGNTQAGVVGVFLNPIAGVSTQIAMSGTAYVSSAMTGGTDPETNDQIRANAPAFFATAQRAVSLSDFVAMAQNIPGVTAATAVAAHSTSVTLYLMGANNQPASVGIQNNAEAFFNGKTLAGVTVTTAQPTLVPIDIGTNSNQMALIVQNGFSQTGVLAKVNAALAALLSSPNTSFGQTVNVGTIYATVLAITGVAYCVIPLITREDAPQADTSPIVLRGFEIAVPGNFHIQASGGV